MITLIVIPKRVLTEIKFAACITGVQVQHMIFLIVVLENHARLCLKLAFIAKNCENFFSIISKLSFKKLLVVE